MQPRLTTSKKWTPLPAELATQIRQIFSENFERETNNGELIAEGRIYPEEIILRIGFLENGRLMQLNFEVSVQFNPMKQNALEQIHYAIDCAGSLMTDYFEDEDLDRFPRQWQSVQFNNRELFVQITTVNSKLEAEADRLLGVAADGEESPELQDGLVKGNDYDTDLKVATSLLGLGDDLETDTTADASDTADELDEEEEPATTPIPKKGSKTPIH